MIGACQRQVSLAEMQPLHRAQAEVEERLLRARAAGRLRGAMVLATCNRFEVLVDTDQDVDALEAEVFAGYGVPLQSFCDEAALEHLIRVATGLESLVLGEDQIQGQVTQAFRSSGSLGLLSKGLNMVYSRVVQASRRTRQSRPVVASARSVAELAARICRKAGARIAIIGAGSTAQTAAESLRELGATSLHFANRTVANAQGLASHFDGTAGSIDELLASPPEVEAVIVAIQGRQLSLPVANMPSLQAVVDISQPTVVTGLDGHPRVRFLDLDGLARCEQQHEQALQDWQRRGAAGAVEAATAIWTALRKGEVDLGQLLELHVENASAEVERALRGKLRALEPQMAEEVRRLAERVARRNAHLHLSDVRHFAQS